MRDKGPMWWAAVRAALSQGCFPPARSLAAGYRRGLRAGRTTVPQFHHKAARLLAEKQPVQDRGGQGHRARADGQVDQGDRQGAVAEEEDDQRQPGPSPPAARGERPDGLPSRRVCSGGERSPPAHLDASPLAGMLPLYFQYREAKRILYVRWGPILPGPA